jgi:hypothetical protein
MDGELEGIWKETLVARCTVSIFSWRDCKIAKNVRLVSVLADWGVQLCSHGTDVDGHCQNVSSAVCRLSVVFSTQTGLPVSNDK